MQALTSFLAALILLFVLALPAGSRDSLAQSPGAELIKLTFRLTLNGEGPERDSFYGSYNGLDRGPGFRPVPLYFCGPPGSLSNTQSYPECRGGGAVYSIERMVGKGADIEFRLIRNFASSPGKPFATGARAVGGDTTISAYYNYDSEEGGLGQDPNVPDMPDTGAGGCRR